MTRHPVRCQECGSNFGHNEGCSQANAAMIRDALIAGKSVPADHCNLCGNIYGHVRGCKLEDLTLKPEQEAAIRSDPNNVSAFDVDCLLHEIDHARELYRSENVRCGTAFAEIAMLKEEIVSLRVMAVNLRPKGEGGA